MRAQATSLCLRVLGSTCTVVRPGGKARRLLTAEGCMDGGDRVTMYLERVWSDVLTAPTIGHRGVDSLYEWTPSYTPPGRRFEPVAERALEPVVRDLASRLPSSASGVLASAQFAGPTGVADFVAVTRAQEILPLRIDVDLPTISNLSDASVVSAIPVRRRIAPLDVAQAVGMSEAQTTRRLRQLRDTGAVIEYQGRYRRHPALVPVGHMYAFEAKVSDWRQATVQALRYARWADAAGIVLLKAPRDLERLKMHARSLRIGVAIGNRWLVRPALQPVSPGLRLFASELFIAALIEATL